ncbi:MAG: hypothetical protein WA949_15800 [Phormidesmis sp.]
MDAFLLTVYFLVVIYVLYQMALSLENRLEDKVIIHLDKAFLAEQTQAQLSRQKEVGQGITAVATDDGFKDGKIKFPVLRLLVGSSSDLSKLDGAKLANLKSIGFDESAISSMLQKRITIQVKPTGQQTVKNPLFYLSVTVNNDTADRQLYLNWDRSSLEMFKQGHRIIRSTPNMPRDLSQPQIFSVVNPGQTVTSDITIEKNYLYSAESNQMVLGRPLINLQERLEMSKLTDPTTDDKNIQPLYNLDLMVGIKRVTDSDTRIVSLLIPFSFTLEIKADEIALPPLRWLLRRVGRNRQSWRGWMWGK